MLPPVGWSKAQRAHHIIAMPSWARCFRSFAPTYRTKRQSLHLSNQLRTLKRITRQRQQASINPPRIAQQARLLQRLRCLHRVLRCQARARAASLPPNNATTANSDLARIGCSGSSDFNSVNARKAKPYAEIGQTNGCHRVKTSKSTNIKNGRTRQPVRQSGLKEVE